MVEKMKDGTEKYLNKKREAVDVDQMDKPPKRRMLNMV